MPWFYKYFEQFKMKPEGDGGGGGGNTPDPKDKEISDLKAKIAAMEAAKGNPDPKPDPTNLRDKAKDQENQKEKEKADSKKLEAALRFSLAAKDWVKSNESILPKNIQGIFDQAEKQTYDSPIEKDCVIKMNIVDEFFSVQANVDLLTQSQKATVEEFSKLTNTKKQERAQAIYEQIFEPLLERLKGEAKARQLNLGNKNQSDGEKALLEKMRDRSRKHYLGEK